MENNKIPGTIQNWENGKLGIDERFAKVHPVSDDLVNKTPDTNNQSNEIRLDAEEQRYALDLSPEHAKVIDDAAGMQEVTIRLNKETFQFLEEKAKQNGMTIRGFIRRILTSSLKDV